jgi:hypothetical protein
LWPEQLEKTKNVKFIVSMPVFELDMETNKVTDKLIGVLNLDSLDTEFKNIQDILPEIIKEMSDLSKIISLLF